MKIFTAEQIGKIDQYTIKNEPISSINLMERAAEQIHHFILDNFPEASIPYHVFCGPGNNGGDGLAVARMLCTNGRNVKVWLLDSSGYSHDNKINWQRLPKNGYLQAQVICSEDDLTSIPGHAIIVDALFGNGLSRPLEGLVSKVVEHINQQGCKVIAIDVPSGMYSDRHSSPPIIRASQTLALQFPKLGLLLPDNQEFVGDWHLIDIGLHPDIILQEETKYHLLDEVYIGEHLLCRGKFAHKGDFGHAMLICGGYGKAGAALLAARACLRSGVGLLTVHIPRFAYNALQASLPEAMVEIDDHEYWFSHHKATKRFNAMGIGCGLGTNPTTCSGFQKLIADTDMPMVIDADGLNIIALNPELISLLPAKSILTPHPGEFKRLFGSFENDFERLSRQRNLSIEYDINIVLKGAHTCITSPDGLVYFNNTGNPGMATAGSGDVLTGMITSLLAQGYDPVLAAHIGTYIHGLAGDLAAREIGQESMIATDIIENIGLAIQQIKRNK